jgi:hypothetical protein
MRSLLGVPRLVGHAAVARVSVKDKVALAAVVVGPRLVDLWKDEFERARLAGGLLGDDEVEDGAKVVGRDDGARDGAEVGVGCCLDVRFLYGWFEGMWGEHTVLGDGEDQCGRMHLAVP